MISYSNADISSKSKYQNSAECLQEIYLKDQEYEKTQMYHQHTRRDPMKYIIYKKNKKKRAKNIALGVVTRRDTRETTEIAISTDTLVPVT